MTDQHYKVAETPKDRLGREIKVGDLICHAVSNGSSAGLNVGRVLAFPMKVESYYVERSRNDSQGNFVPAVMGEMEVLKLKVQPCNADGEPTMEYEMVQDSSAPHGWRRQDTTKPVRKVTIEHLDRTVVIPD